MLRFFGLLILAAGLTGHAMACDMRSQARAATVADYVEDGRVCLQIPGSGYRFDEAMEQHFIDLINQARLERGLSPLILRPELRRAARFHSLDMGVNGFFDHRSPGGKTSAARVAAFDRTLLPKSSAENIAKLELACDDHQGRPIDCHQIPNSDAEMMAGAVAQLHRQLMDSPGHRKNILDPKSTHIALGVARRDHGLYVSQVFANPAGVLDQPMALRVHAGSDLELVVATPGWTFKRFALMRDNLPDDLQNGRIPADTRGDLQLAVRAERDGPVTTSRGKRRQSYQFIYLTGPAVTIVAPTGS